MIATGYGLNILAAKANHYDSNRIRVKYTGGGQIYWWQRLITMVPIGYGLNILVAKANHFGSNSIRVKYAGGKVLSLWFKQDMG